LGFRGLQAKSLNPKHVEALAKHWQAHGISIGTQKNRMAVLRWWAEKVDRQNVIARHNDFYGIPDRAFVSNNSKAVDLDVDALQRVKDDHVRLSLALQVINQLFDGLHLPSLTIPLPVRHQLAPLLQEFAARVCGPGGVRADMRQGQFRHFIRDAGALLCPGAKGRSESMCSHVMAQQLRNFRQVRV